MKVPFNLSSLGSFLGRNAPSIGTGVAGLAGGFAAGRLTAPGAGKSSIIGAKVIGHASAGKTRFMVVEKANGRLAFIRKARSAPKGMQRRAGPSAATIRAIAKAVK